MTDEMYVSLHLHNGEICTRVPHLCRLLAVPSEREQILTFLHRHANLIDQAVPAIAVALGLGVGLRVVGFHAVGKASLGDLLIARTAL